MNVTLKSVPKRLHARLKAAARRNGRSLNTEAIAALEREYLPVRLDPLRHLELVRASRTRHGIEGAFDARAIKVAIEEGRE